MSNLPGGMFNLQRGIFDFPLGRSTVPQGRVDPQRGRGGLHRGWRETAELREGLAAGLQQALPGAEILPGAANYLLCLLPRSGPDAATLCERCRDHGVFLRDSGATSAVLGRHALRVAVKDEPTNRRVLETLGALDGPS